MQRGHRLRGRRRAAAGRRQHRAGPGLRAAPSRLRRLTGTPRSAGAPEPAAPARQVLRPRPHPPARPRPRPRCEAAAHSGCSPAARLPQLPAPAGAARSAATSARSVRQAKAARPAANTSCSVILRSSTWSAESTAARSCSSSSSSGQHRSTSTSRSSPRPGRQRRRRRESRSRRRRSVRRTLPTVEHSEACADVLIHGEPDRLPGQVGGVAGAGPGSPQREVAEVRRLERGPEPAQEAAARRPDAAHRHVEPGPDLLVAQLRR